jgi:hypothetical protein
MSLMGCTERPSVTAYYTPARANRQVDPTESFSHPVPLGANLYAEGRPKVAPPPRRHDGGAGPAAAAAAKGGGVEADVASRRVGGWGSGEGGRVVAGEGGTPL